MGDGKFPGGQVEETVGYDFFGGCGADSHVDLWGQLLAVLAAWGVGKGDGAD